MTEDPSTSWETLENELEASLERLEAPGIPLEERLHLHNRATEVYRSLEKRLAEARAELEPRDEDDAPPEAKEEETEGYEALSGRLEQTVAAMEAPELPLQRVLALRREALALAARCERILESASGRIRNLDLPEDGAGEGNEDVDAPF